MIQIPGCHLISQIISDKPIYLDSVSLFVNDSFGLENL